MSRGVKIGLVVLAIVAIALLALFWFNSALTNETVVGLVG